ncbi:sporulation protein YunB [Bhargavaea beijingensis]|uniref:Sporulation protein YunB n=1 Tax=Bhargavaea beijingensis TaxID=426756 RepID=A0ABX9Z9R4_9BACL|nr:sporulation protein YunB [Bhargavaea beijingensis]
MGQGDYLLKFPYARRRRLRPGAGKRRLLPLLLPFGLILMAAFFYALNARLGPALADYAEVQTQKIASEVIAKAIDARTANVLDINDIIEYVPSEQSEMVTAKLNTEIINRFIAETHGLVSDHLEMAEAGELNTLPKLENIEYDVETMKDRDGIVFFVPLGQALGMPIIGNLGPKIPIRFHVIGDVHANPNTEIREFGINNALVQVDAIIQVNVRIIVPFASKQSRVEQRIPIAIGLVQGQVPHIFNKGENVDPPSIEVPIPLPDE